MTRFYLCLLRLLACLPLPLLRLLGWAVGCALFVLVRPRRHVVLRNLALCFPALSAPQRVALGRQVFIAFVQAWLDRGWLWHASAQRIKSRLHWHDPHQALAGNQPTVLLVPHFMGLDAAGTALTLYCPRSVVSIYTPQGNAVLDHWIVQGRSRFGTVNLYQRTDGVKPLIKALRQGALFYLLPDMDFGPKDTVFVPFFGVDTCTTPSLHRFAKLGPARVVTLRATLQPNGYHVEVLPALDQFPSDDALADTARMNAHIEQLVRQQPAQYYWVHKRFKTRPEGEASLYDHHD